MCADPLGGAVTPIQLDNYFIKYAYTQPRIVLTCHASFPEFFSPGACTGALMWHGLFTVFNVSVASVPVARALSINTLLHWHAQQCIIVYNHTRVFLY